jgi:hypothetical protein
MEIKNCQTILSVCQYYVDIHVPDPAGKSHIVFLKLSQN